MILQCSNVKAMVGTAQSNNIKLEQTEHAVCSCKLWLLVWCPFSHFF